MLSPAIPVVLAGKVAPLGSKGASSAIAKIVTPAPWRITRTGLAGDEQADLKNHGGPEKAIHHYPLDHYDVWRSEIGDHALLDRPGAFGENLSTTGWTEENVNVGDIVRFGTAILQIAQGRQPCWKLDARFAREAIAYRTQMSGRTGWYYRVLEEGVAEEGSALTLVDRPQPDWPLARLTALLYRDRDRYDDLAAMAELPELAPGWRKLAARRVETRATESWTARLTGSE
jgi:MOSC domain-containing protein YiiM